MTLWFSDFTRPFESVLSTAGMPQGATPQATAADPPWLLIALAASVVISLGLAGWMTWRSVGRNRAAPQTETVLPAAAAQTSTFTRDAVGVAQAPPKQPSSAGPTPRPTAGSRYQLTGVGGGLKGVVLDVDDECLVSRSEVGWVVIPDSSISAPHAALDLAYAPPRVKDLSSRNGVRLGQAVLGTGFTALEPGQTLQIGSLSLVFEGGALRVERGPLQGRTFELPPGLTVLSRREMPVRVTGDADPALSDAHALLFVEGSQLFVKDLNSRNGTRVNEVMISRPTPLHPDDLVQFGQSTFKVHTNR